MFNSFDSIEQYLSEKGIRKTIVLAGSNDDRALEAIVRAHDKCFVDAVLVGSEAETRKLLALLGAREDDYTIVDVGSENRAARKAIAAVESGEADFPMKGLMQTATFLMALQCSTLCEEGALLNEATVFHYADQDRMVVAGDCAVNVAPSLEQKAGITKNLIGAARALGADPVRVAALSVIENPTPTIPSSMEAHELAGMDWGEDVVVEGPLALDNVLDAEAAKHKGIESEVAGRADVIVMPDIHAGNVFHKCVHFFGHYSYASGLLGAKIPVVMNSRTDDIESKYNSILIAILQSMLEVR